MSTIGVGKSVVHDGKYRHVEISDVCHPNDLIDFARSAIDLAKDCSALGVRDIKIRQTLIQVIKKNIKQEQQDLFLMDGFISAINKSYPLHIKQKQTIWYDDVDGLELTEN